MNFLAETLADITSSGHEPSECIYIGSHDGYSCTWDEFTTLADFDYDAGFGAAYIASDLEIHFSDGSSLRRTEYDGSEAWEFAAPLVIPDDLKPIRTLQGGRWPMLAEQQREWNERAGR